MMMNIQADKIEHWLEHHPNITFAGHELDWLNQQRQNALSALEQIGLPSVRDEQWRYTNLRALKSNAYAPSSLSEDTLSSKTQQSLNLILEKTTSEAIMVFINGHFSKEFSNFTSLGHGVVLTNTAHALQHHSDKLESTFNSSVESYEHGFSALNTAYFQDGFTLLLPENTHSENTIETIFISTQLSQDALPVSHNRNLIVAGSNAKITVVERHIGSDGEVYLNNSITEIIAGNNAHVDHYKLQQESNDAFHIGGVFIKQAAHSNVKNHNIGLSGLVVRNDVSSSLEGQGAHNEMNGLVMGKDRQHFDNHTQVNHQVAHCTSDEYYKSILDDHSRSVFRGRIIVAQDAQQTNADQQNNNLLLSDNAEADTKPQLEIYADDVKCSHGATVGQLDKKSLFYLQSRGIDRQSAIALLTFAFANEVIDRINIDSLQQELTQLIAGELLQA